MEPTSPVLTEEFVPLEIVYAKDQPQYRPLPAIRNPAGVVLTRWKLTDEEREAIQTGADILFLVHTYNAPLQPLLPSVITCDRDLMRVVELMNLVEQV